MSQEARQKNGRDEVRTGGVIGKLTGGVSAVRGLASKTGGDITPAMTASKPVFQVCEGGAAGWDGELLLWVLFSPWRRGLLSLHVFVFFVLLY